MITRSCRQNPAGADECILWQLFWHVFHWIVVFLFGYILIQRRYMKLRIFVLFIRFSSSVWTSICFQRDERRQYILLIAYFINCKYILCSALLWSGIQPMQPISYRFWYTCSLVCLVPQTTEQIIIISTNHIMLFCGVRHPFDVCKEPHHTTKLKL